MRVPCCSWVVLVPQGAPSSRSHRKVVCSFPRGLHGKTIFDARYAAGKVELERVPQATLAERIRAAAAGIGGCRTRTAAGTDLAKGKETRIIRSGHIDIACLGAFQVAAQVWVLMDHCQKDGSPRILERCTDPLTAANCVDRIYTDLAMIVVTPAGLVVERLAAGLDFDELQRRTGARLQLSADCQPYRFTLHHNTLGDHHA